MSDIIKTGIKKHGGKHQAFIRFQNQRFVVGLPPPTEEDARWTKDLLEKALERNGIKFDPETPQQNK